MELKRGARVREGSRSVFVVKCEMLVRSGSAARGGVQGRCKVALVYWYREEWPRGWWVGGKGQRVALLYEV